ncbi:MAG: methyltransferase [Bdellovibrionaceae bacterium]|nr:methyltransferase [Pseudobdellovibrionaceae bacterium]MBX3032492.1 methyltransferase [Pseudobdellovibrionaceae bacterium]
MLWVVATPVGDANDLTLRALDILKNCDVLICESTKETSRLLRAHGISGKTYEVLDEHSKPEDVHRLADLCRDRVVALVSDGGTPAFCDPGADLVARCRQLNIEIKPALGASSLMGLLSLAGRRLDQFVFRGFIPAESEARARALRELQKEKRAVVLMDTPYRLKKMLAEMEEHFPQRKLFLVRDLSLPGERCLEGRAADLRRACGDDKAEFMLLLLPE